MYRDSVRGFDVLIFELLKGGWRCGCGVFAVGEGEGGNGAGFVVR